MTSHCTRCGETKECSIFAKRLNKDGTTYLRYMCKPCRRNRYRNSKGSRYVEPVPTLEEIIQKGIESNQRLMKKYAHAH